MYCYPPQDEPVRAYEGGEEEGWGQPRGPDVRGVHRSIHAARSSYKQCQVSGVGCGMRKIIECCVQILRVWGFLVQCVTK